MRKFILLIQNNLLFLQFKTNNMKKYIWSFYLGLSLSIVGYNFMDWQFYLVMIPTIMLVVWGYDEDIKDVD